MQKMQAKEQGLHTLEGVNDARTKRRNEEKEKENTTWW